MDWHLDARERGWHWSCAAQVLAAWPGQGERVEPRATPRRAGLNRGILGPDPLGEPQEAPARRLENPR